MTMFVTPAESPSVGRQIREIQVNPGIYSTSRLPRRKCSDAASGYASLKFSDWHAVVYALVAKLSFPDQLLSLAGYSLQICSLCVTFFEEPRGPSTRLRPGHKCSVYSLV